MGKINAAITGVQGYVPDYILTNKELETLVDTNDEWITSRTGVKERRILKGEGKGSSDLGAQAIKGLLEKTNTSAEDIDLIICATATPDMIFPSTACIIADKVGAKNAFAYDIMAACSGFLFSVDTASKFIESGSYKKIIVVGAGEVGTYVAERLNKQHDVALVENNLERFREIDTDSSLDVLTVYGSGTDPDALSAARQSAPR